jgi:hypothetical protein
MDGLHWWDGWMDWLGGRLTPQMWDCMNAGRLTPRTRWMGWVGWMDGYSPIQKAFCSSSGMSSNISIGHSPNHFDIADRLFRQRSQISSAM